MTSRADFAKCLTFIGCHLHAPEQHLQSGLGLDRPAITLTRQTGTGAMDIARRLADFLQSRAPASCGWAVFDKNLVTRMLQEHNLPEQLAEFIPEDRISKIRDALEDVLGLHPPTETLVHQVSETAMHLAEMGHVILVGRAANIVTRHLPNVFHVRLVAPLEKRVEEVMSHRELDRAAALAFVDREDVAHRRFLKEYFHKSPDDVLLYDLVVNTGRFTFDETARLIGEAVLGWAKVTKPA